MTAVQIAAFTLAARTAVQHAMDGKLPESMQTSLAISALALVHDRAELRLATLDFLRDVRLQPRDAALRLVRVLDEALRSEPDAREAASRV